MPRDLKDEIGLIMSDIGQQVKDLATRTELHAPADTLAAERGLAAIGRQLADRVMELMVRRTVEEPERPNESGELTAGRSAGKSVPLNTRAAGRRETPVLLLGGRRIRVRTSYRIPKRRPRPGRRRGVGRRGKAGSGCYPRLAALGIHAGATPATAADVAREMAEAASIEVARDSLSQRGLVLEHKTVRRIAYRFAEMALALRSERTAGEAKISHPAGVLAGKRIVASVDGGRIRIRERPRCGRRRTETRHRGFKAQWREPKVLTAYSIDEQGRKERRRLSLADGTMEDADAVFTLLVGHLRLLGAHEAATLVLIGDGARWIWDRVDALVEGVGIPAHRFVAIVDFYHALEHLQHVADLRAGWSVAERRKWYRRAKRALRKGNVEKVIAEIDALRIGRRAKAIATERRYFAKNMEAMRYRDFERRGLPIGSGAVESAIRRVVNQRLKGNGCFWLEEHAEGILHLRANLKAGRWDELVHDVLDYHATRRA
jgi:hypothetical protein